MNEEIEEMMLTVPQKIVAYDGNHAVQHLYREQRREIAEALYNAGYGDVNEYKAEIERLKEKCEELRNEKWDAQDDLDCYCDEMPTRINQAVKEFADEIKAKLNAIFGKTICSDLDTEDITDIIDELLKEYENGKNKD